MKLRIVLSMDVRVMLMIGVLSANINCILAEEWKDLDKIFYPIKLTHKSLHLPMTHKPVTEIKKTTENIKTTEKKQVTENTKVTNNKQVTEKIKVTDNKKVTETRKKYNKPDTSTNFKNQARKKKMKDDRHLLDRTFADVRGRRVSVLCWVLTYPENHDKAMHIKETWGHRCDKLLFMSTEEDLRLPTVELKTVEGRMFLWGKTQAALKYLYENNLEEADWFFKADDDTYVVVENLKYLLDEFNANDPIYLGARLKSPLTESGYMSGGAGYVMSREAVTRVVTRGLDPKICNVNIEGGAEDLDLKICLDKVGVYPVDSRDVYRRGRFFSFLPHFHVNAQPHDNFWYWSKVYYESSLGRDCCSEFAVSFHYVDQNMMYILEYFVYHLRLYGIGYEYDDNHKVKRYRESPTLTFQRTDQLS